MVNAWQLAALHAFSRSMRDDGREDITIRFIDAEEDNDEDSQDIKVHSIVLSAHSPILAQMCEARLELGINIIELEGNESKYIKMMLDYFYSGVYTGEPKPDQPIRDAGNRLLSEYSSAWGLSMVLEHATEMCNLAKEYAVPHLAADVIQMLRDDLEYLNIWDCVLEEFEYLDAVAGVIGAIYHDPQATVEVQRALCQDILQRNHNNRDGVDLGELGEFRENKLLLDLVAALRKNGAALMDEVEILRQQSREEHSARL